MSALMCCLLHASTVVKGEIGEKGEIARAEAVRQVAGRLLIAEVKLRCPLDFQVHLSVG